MPWHLAWMSGAASYITFDELVETLGEDGAKALCGAFGGQRVYVPAVCRPDHAITKAIGSENAAKLADIIVTGSGGLTVELPVGPFATYPALRRRMLELAADPTLTEREVAQRLGVNGRSVRRVRAKFFADAALRRAKCANRDN